MQKKEDDRATRVPVGVVDTRIEQMSSRPACKQTFASLLLRGRSQPAIRSKLCTVRYNPPTAKSLPLLQYQLYPLNIYPAFDSYARCILLYRYRYTRASQGYRNTTTIVITLGWTSSEWTTRPLVFLLNVSPYRYRKNAMPTKKCAMTHGPRCPPFRLYLFRSWGLCPSPTCFVLLLFFRYIQYNQHNHGAQYRFVINAVYHTMRDPWFPSSLFFASRKNHGYFHHKRIVKFGTYLSFLTFVSKTMTTRTDFYVLVSERMSESIGKSTCHQRLRINNFFAPKYFTRTAQTCGNRLKRPINQSRIRYNYYSISCSLTNAIRPFFQHINHNTLTSSQQGMPAAAPTMTTTTTAGYTDRQRQILKAAAAAKKRASGLNRSIHSTYKWMTTSRKEKFRDDFYAGRYHPDHRR